MECHGTEVFWDVQVHQNSSLNFPGHGVSSKAKIFGWQKGALIFSNRGVLFGSVHRQRALTHALPQGTALIELSVARPCYGAEQELMLCEEFYLV